MLRFTSAETKASAVSGMTNFAGELCLNQMIYIFRAMTMMMVKMMISDVITNFTTFDMEILA